MSDMLNIALLGNGGHQIQGHLHRCERIRLVAAHGPVFTDAWAAEYRENNPRFASDLQIEASIDALLAREDVDLVSICHSRRDEQGLLTARALEGGKHVLGEKPLATRQEDLQAIRDASKKSGRHAWAMLPMVYYPGVNAIRQHVQDGKLGTIVQCYGMKSYPYRDSRPQDRGVDSGITQAAVHAFSFICHATGQRFTEVFAADTGRGNPEEGDLQMAATFVGKLADGAQATVLANYCNAPGVGYWGNDQLRIHGTEGFIELVDGFKRRQLALGENKPVEYEDVPPAVPYLQDIFDSILENRPAFLTPELSDHCTAVCIAANRSIASGRPEPIT